MNETTLSWAAFALCIASVVILWSANHKRNHKEQNKFQNDYQMDYRNDSIAVRDGKRKVGTVHYTKLDSLICGDNQ